MGKNSMGKRIKAVKPELERYTGLEQQIKEKSKERKALLEEKKETPFYQIPKLHISVLYAVAYTLTLKNAARERSLQ